MRHLLSVLMVLALTATAAAQDEEPSADERAAMHFRAAMSYFDDENFEQALVEFRSAHELSGRPEMRYNIGLTLERLGRWDEAAAAHEAFLEEAPDHPDAAEARTRMDRARGRAQREQETGERVSPVDGNDPVRDPQPLEEAEPVDESETNEGSRAAPWIVLGASAAVGVVALGTGLAAHGIHGELEDDCPGGVCPAERAGDVDKGRALARASTALTFVALAGAVTGVILFFVGGEEERTDRVALEMAPTRGGGYVQGRLTF